MESKDQTDPLKQTSNINIDINGGGNEPDESDVKNMNLDSQGSSRVGLSKDELMKYANQPFWIRLRNILFASFWIVWLSILVAAIGYVIHSPGCKVVSATNVTLPIQANSASGPS